MNLGAFQVNLHSVFCFFLQRKHPLYSMQWQDAWCRAFVPADLMLSSLRVSSSRKRSSSWTESCPTTSWDDNSSTTWPSTSSSVRIPQPLDLLHPNYRPVGLSNYFGIIADFILGCYKSAYTWQRSQTIKVPFYLKPFTRDDTCS